jgi:hypothetical protein
MAGLSLYGRDQSLAAFFMPDLFDAPALVYVALTLVLPTEGDTGSDLIEPSDPIYLRQPYQIGSEFWGLTGRGGASNLDEISWGVPSVDWGDMRGWALCSDESGGRTYYLGELNPPLRVIYDPDVERPVTAGAGFLVVKHA